MTERQRKLSELKAKRAKQGYSDRVNFVLDNDKVFKGIKESISELSEMIGYQKTEANINTSHIIKALQPLNSLQPELEKIVKLSAEIGQKEFPKPLEKVKVKNLDQLIKAVEKEGRLVELIDKKIFKDIHKALVNITQRLESQTVKLDIDREPGEFVPVRRVIKIGNRLVYDDSTHSGGGGGGSGTPTITADSPQIDAVPVVNPDGSNIGGSSSSGDGAIQDGANSAIEATVLDYASSNPLAVRLTDTGGDYVSAGAGTQYTEDVAAAADPIGTALNLIRKDTLAAITTTDGDNVAARGTNKGELYVKHADTVTVDGSGVTQPVSNAGLTELAAAINASSQMDVNIAAGNITGFATSAKQDTIIGHLDGVEALLTTIDADTSNLSVVGGGTEAAAQRVTIANDSTGVLSVDDNGGSLTVDNAHLTSLGGAVSGTEVQVDVVGALPAGTNNIGDIDVLSVPADPFGANADAASATGSISAKLRFIAATGIPITGTVAVTQSGTWDEVGINDSGNSITVDNGGTFATQATLQAGTAAIGKLLPPDIDVTAHTNYAKKYYTNAGAVTDGIIWSPASGKRWHVVSMHIITSAAATVTLEDDKAGGDEVVWKAELAANAGESIHFGEKYPLASGEDAADLIVTTSAGNIYITVTGYEI